MISPVRFIAQFFEKIRSRSEIEAILTDLLTPAEIEDISQRIRITEGLMDGKTQREVAESLEVSIAKVTRGAHALKSSRGGFSFLFSKKK